MKDGTTQPIETVVQGEEVLSKDEQTGRIEARRVAQVSRRTVGRVVRVTLTDPVTKQSQTLTATADHPFYVAGKGFVPAGQLGIGTSIVTRAGPALTVSGSAFLPEQVGGYVVYNLTVEGDHTYFVGSVDGGAWVHNITCSNVTYPGTFTQDEALNEGLNWVGKDYKEMMGRSGNGGYGTWRSADGLRQFRMSDTDLMGHPNMGPHVHYQTFDQFGREIENIHVLLSP